jgi:DNA polymerase-3 subunit alpha
VRPSFIHLRVHSEYSLVDSVIRLPALVAATADQQMPAIALTDQSNLFGYVKFYKACLAAGIKPVIGADLNVETSGTRLGYAPLVCICRNQQGYNNLKKLVTRSYVEGQINGVPVVKKDWLSKESLAGLVILSGGREGAVGQWLLDDKIENATAFVKLYSDLTGDDFYIELHRTGRAAEDDYVEQAVMLAASMGIPVVATNDVRFLTADDFEAHETRTCVQGGYQLNDRKRPRLYSEQQYLRSPAEMQELFADLPEALENSVEIATRCNVELTLGKSVLPDYEIPSGEAPDDYLRNISREGLSARLAGANLPQPKLVEYEQRLDTELGVIRSMGFAGYFLIVADFIRWAKENGVPVGPGRGSGAGSLVAWVIGITDIDPLQFDLLFERFLNPERISMPDFDVDFCMEGRDRVIDYVAERYGRDRVAQIITYGTMGAKAVVRDVARVMGHPYGFADRIARLIPPTPGMTLKKAFEEEPELGQICAEDEDVSTVMDMARQLEGLARNAGTHAGGVVISPSELTDFAPLYQPDGETGVVTQFDMKDIESVGLVKFDFLGLRTLTVIDKALRTANQARSKQGVAPIRLEELPMDDALTFGLLQASKTHAVFQLESRGMRDLIKRLRPDCFDDIVALVALFRPGPLESGMVDTYIDRKHAGDDADIDYLHPLLEPVLKSTYGVILYQEQVMQAAQVLSGYSLGQADLLRRAMGKKDVEEMARQRDGFVEGAIATGVKDKQATYIFDLIEKFAGYGFNKSHSAAYALLAYQTAWLKAHYPEAFMAAVLSADMEVTDKLKLHHRECKSMAIRLLSPDVNQSVTMFMVTGERELGYGLGAIKGLGRQAADAIVAERDAKGSFRDLHDFCIRMDTQRINKRAVESLIKAGAFDAMGPNRPSLLADVPVVMSAAEQYARIVESGQNDMFGAAEPPPPPPRSTSSLLPRWSPRTFYLKEYEALGLFLSGHPFDQYRDDCPYICSGSITSIVGSMTKPKSGEEAWKNSKDVSMAGVISEIRKRGNRVTMYLDDGHERVEVTLFSEGFQKFRHLIDEHAIRVVSGKLRYDDFVDGWRLQVKDIRDIDRVIEQRASHLTIHWLAREDAELGPDELRGILAPFRPGRCDVALNYRNQDAEARMPLGKEWKVRPSGELRERLAETIGIKAFKFIYERSGGLN